MEVLVFAFLSGSVPSAPLTPFGRSSRALQHAFEGVEGFIQGQSEEIIGITARATQRPAVLALFILFCNLIGIVPGFESRPPCHRSAGLRYLCLHLLPESRI